MQLSRNVFGLALFVLALASAGMATPLATVSNDNAYYSFLPHRLTLVHIVRRE